MLKLETSAFEIGTRLTLRESWHEKLQAFSKKKKNSYEYTVVDIVKINKETYYICKGVNDKEEVAFTQVVLMYIFAKEVPDSNVGFLFKEYLPLENTCIMMTNIRNPSIIVPAIMKLELGVIGINDKEIVCFDFNLFFINGSGFAQVIHYSEGSKKSYWKFVYNSDESYMTAYEQQMKDTIIHKEFVKRSIDKLARYLEHHGATEHAKLLRERGEVHDQSKMNNVDELHALARIIGDKSTLSDANKQLSPIKKDALQLHWKNNSHHPEHFKTPMDMSKLDVMEMCCDWHARSTQYKTDLKSYVNTQQEIRFHFPDWMFAEIIHYCDVLLTDV